MEEQNAYDLARMKRTMMEDLIELREVSDKSQREVADIIGRHRSAVCKFESMSGDPKLSTVFRYAHAIGAMIDISVSSYPTWLRNASMSPVDLSVSSGWREQVGATGSHLQGVSMPLTAWATSDAG